MNYIICFLLAALLNLEEGAQDFVLETKKITIPAYPDAFNASIIPFQEGYLLSFRTGLYLESIESDSVLHKPITSKNLRSDDFGLILLDKNFDITSAPKLLPLHNEAQLQQDPRLVVVDETIYIVYCNKILGVTLPLISRVFVAELHYDGKDFSMAPPECLSHFQDSDEGRREKNWPPFAYEGHLLVAYKIAPHRIFYPLLDGSGSCVTLAETNCPISWDFGELRGGTPALREGDDYLAFFHSCKNIATTHSSGQKMLHYFIGAYTFSAKPPFALTRVSPEPIVGKNFYEGEVHKTWKPLRVVFPCGFVSDEDFVWLTYGRQDHEIWVAKLDKKALLKSLSPV